MLGLVMAGLIGVARPAHAQVTRADSAAVLLDAARSLEAEGNLELAEALFDLVSRRYADTPSGADAATALTTVRAERQAGRGYAGYVVWSTIFGAWMGFAVPAAFGADDPEPYGVGLLLATPVSFLASRAYGRSADMTVGASRTITYSWLWGTWQAIGWQAALDIGDEEICEEWGCYTDSDDEAPWVAAVVGGLGGYAAGIAATRAWNVDTGMSELIWHSSIWGTGYGWAIGYMADLHDDDLLAATLLGGDAGLIAAIPAANAWRPSSGRVRLISVTGLAGAVAGLGVDLLAQPDEEKVAVAIPTVGATLGLILGGVLTRNYDSESRRDEVGPGGFEHSLLQIGGETRLGIPAPMPVLRSRLLPDGTTEWDPGVSFSLFRAVF